jgi:2-oxoglutarate ferredoxin oxidoreductase subunit delta
MPAKAQEIIVDPRLCKGCHICIHVCPHEVLEKSPDVDNRGFYLPRVIDITRCKVCHLCEMHCPDFAIRVVAEGEEK